MPSAATRKLLALIITAKAAEPIKHSAVFNNAAVYSCVGISGDE